ncbi:hypothetical protein [Streptomyces sp. A1136]|uniref:hypothetical protein n=1 Tax=Streptomyces sp. A1136 TaxID=2563102 RepID=UPI00109EBCCE|nr:hypothetical protein [Streptomyces sp. A1136]THA54255.1 hypothetical protein E6R62_16965 [Streptomyces sp. A1136]
MTTQSPQSPAYPLPDGREISTAAHDALNAHFAAVERLGRVMAVVTAAAVRDILTDNDHDAPFDAAHAELIEAADGSLHGTGRYWTADGTETSFTEAIGEQAAGMGVFGMNEWTPYLGYENEKVWKPLVEELPPRGGQQVYRLDLAKAAALPLD